MLDEYGLSPKQKAWCDYYIECGNAIEAAKKAGYKSPKNSADDNRNKPTCKRYIADRMRPTEEKRIATADEVLQFLTDVMLGKVKDQFGLDASLQDRTNAAKELMKRYAVADQRQQGTLQRLDGLLMTFKAAIEEAPAQALTGDTAPITVDDTAPTP